MTSVYSPPTLFLRRLKKAFAGQSLSLREVARRIGVSPAYVSCLLNGERNSPDNKIISKLEQVLDVRPRGSLFDAAQRHDTLAVRVFKNETARSFVNACEKLTDEEIDKVLKEAERLAKKYHPEEHEQ